MHVKSDIKSFTRSLKIREKFYESPFTDNSLVYNKSRRNFTPDNPELKTIIENIENIQPTSFEKPDNLSKHERVALKDLKDQSDIIIKTADKGSNLVIMDTDFYRNKLVITDHLNSTTYQKIDSNCDKKVMEKLKKHVKSYKNCLTEKEQDYLTNFEWNTSNFYILPKVHKSKIIKDQIENSDTYCIEVNSPDDLKGRPIIAGCSSPTHRLSALLDKILSPIGNKVQTYIKDDWDFLHKLPNHMEYKKVTLYSVDITSLYTSINNNLGIEAICFWLDKHKELIPERFSKDFIIQSLKFVLENNNFLFDEEFYQQVNGTAMGTKVAPIYACLTIAYLEESKLFNTVLPNIFNVEQCKWISNYYKRYMDDGFLPLLNSIEIETFINCLNALHPAIKFTFERATFESINDIYSQTLNFLDVKVILDSNNRITSDIFYNPTNAHDYLNHNSDHPEHTKRNVPYNLAKRIICFVSDQEQTELRLSELKSLLLKRDYPEWIIQKAFFNAKLQGRAPAPTKNQDTIPFVTTNYSNYKSQNIIKQTNSSLANIQDPSLKNIFKNAKIIQSQRQPKNLISQLTKSKYNGNNDSSNNEEVKISKCNDTRCLICKYYLQPITNFKLSNGDLWVIKRNMSCKSKNVIYFLSCNQCDGKATYIGKTNNLRFRTNQHISTCRTGRGSDKFDQHVFECGKFAPREPFFKLYPMLQLNNEDALLTYEKHFQMNGYDTINAPSRRH